VQSRLLAAGAAVVVLGGAAVLPADEPAARRRGRDFWKALAEDCAVPTGETAFGLVREAASLLGDRDSFWRDDVGYGVVASCVYQQKRLRPEERRALVAELSANLRRGIGEVGSDSVLLRSFSALDLSILAAVELQEPALDPEGYRQLLDAALASLCDERDLRGLVPGLGWVHATAHTADLLKFLARDTRFAPADQQRLLEAAWTRVTVPGEPVFTHAEDERLAAALVSVVRRADFDPRLLEEWLARFVEQEKAVWRSAPPEASALAAAQNARNLLRSLFVLVSLPQPAPTAGQESARERLLATLQQVRR
jgi:hypothetical protein